MFEQDNLTTFEECWDVDIKAVHPIVDESKRLFLNPGGDYF